MRIGENEYRKMFDENGKYIPLSTILPKPQAENPKPKRRRKSKGVTYGISVPMWTAPDPQLTRLLRERMKPRFCGNKPYEQSWNDDLLKRIKEGIKKKGWHQVYYGREFIERSYVLAKDPKKLFAKGINNYDCATGEYYFDIQFGLYWRYTGSFD